MSQTCNDLLEGGLVPDVEYRPILGHTGIDYDFAEIRRLLDEIIMQGLAVPAHLLASWPHDGPASPG